VNSLLLETVLSSGQTIQLVQGDITDETTDAIVNAANTYLQHGAGVAGAILRKGGPVIQRESDAWVQSHGSVSHGVPAWTTGGNLSCRIVIHAVGPVWGDGDEDEKLAVAITGSLRLADELGLGTIAFPAISTGIFGFPKERAAGVMFGSIRKYLATPSGLHLIRLVLYDTSTITAFEKAWHDHFDPKP
jgi:O-acetyl-ADP-ribose deacetylase (regulator of RNase III)